MRISRYFAMATFRFSNAFFLIGKHKNLVPAVNTITVPGRGGGMLDTIPWNKALGRFAGQPAGPFLDMADLPSSPSYARLSGDPIEPRIAARTTRKARQ